MTHTCGSVNGKKDRSFPKNKWTILLTSVQKPVYIDLQMKVVFAHVSSVVPGLTVWSLLARL